MRCCLQSPKASAQVTCQHCQGKLERNPLPNYQESWVPEIQYALITSLETSFIEEARSCYIMERAESTTCTV